MKLQGKVLVWVLLCGSSVGATAQSYTGVVSVVDGDTVHMREFKFRFHGIDAPESSQLCTDATGQQYRCGQVAANALDKKIAGRTVTCEERDRDRYGRIVAVCKVAGEDLNRWMVQSGLAVAYLQYSKDYAADEQTARAQKVGIWAGTFQMPAEYRKEGKAPSNGTPRAVASVPSGSSAGVGVAPNADGECPSTAPLKGSSGKKYHFPGGRYYASFKAKMCFATDADAESAGFVKAKGQ